VFIRVDVESAKKPRNAAEDKGNYGVDALFSGGIGGALAAKRWTFMAGGIRRGFRQR